MSVGSDHRTGPGMFELDAALRVVEAHTCRIAPHLDGLDAQIRHAPHLVEYHLGIGCLHHLLHRLGRHPEHPLLLIDTADTVHLFKIVHIAGTDGFHPVDPQLTEVQRTSVERRHVCHPQLALPLPSRQGHTSADGSTALSLDDGRSSGRPTVLRANEHRLIDRMYARGQVDGHPVFHRGVVQPTQLACLAQGSRQRRLRLFLCPVVGIVAAGRHPDVGSRQADTCRQQHNRKEMSHNIFKVVKFHFANGIHTVISDLPRLPQAK